MQINIRWMKLMRYGEKLGCHQRPDRSLFIKGYQMPVCARCTGVIIGYLFALPMFFMHSFSWVVALSGCSLLLYDWGRQALRIKESTNMRRLITGLVGGFGFMSIQLKLATVIIHSIRRKA